MGLADREAKRAGRGVVASILHTEAEQRISLAVLPSLYESVKKIAFVERRSISELVAQLLEQYVQENGKKLEDYEKMNCDP